MKSRFTDNLDLKTNLKTQENKKKQTSFAPVGPPSVEDLAKIRFSVPPPLMMNLTGINVNRFNMNQNFSNKPNFPLNGPEYRQNVSHVPLYNAYPPPNVNMQIPNAVKKIPKSPPQDSQQIDTEWTPAMKSYVQRSFNMLKNDQDKDKLQAYFAKFFNYVFLQNMTRVIDWDNEPYPAHVFTQSVSVHSRLGSVEESVGLVKNKKKNKKKKKKLVMTLDNVDVVENFKNIQQRKNRFADINRNNDTYNSINSRLGSSNFDDEFHLSDCHIVGTCTSIEKKFFRLTTLPDASTVRPQNILEKSLKFHINKWKNDHNYSYTCDQLKSIRQDLTIQGICNDFSIQVYETHARITLEAGDNSEFNQCQSQLKQIYSNVDSGSRNEFLCYRILYAIFVKNQADLAVELEELFKKPVVDELKFAVDFSHAWITGNYTRMLEMSQDSPKMCIYIINWFLERERETALKRMIKCYRPSLNLQAVKSCLFLFTDQEAVDIASNIGVTFDSGVIDCKKYAELLNVTVQE